MSQHDLTIDNQGFPAFRADLNNALQALGSTQSGTTAPSPTFANQLWYDTTNNQLKIRNEDNDAWITLLTLDQSADSVSQLATAIAVLSAGTAGAPALTTTGDTNTGMFFPAADTIAFAEGGTEVMRIDSNGDVGIGNNDPQAKLSVGAGTTAPGFGTASKMIYLCDTTQPELLIRETGGSVVTSIYADSSSGNIRTATNHPFIFATNNSERGRFTSGGYFKASNNGAYSSSTGSYHEFYNSGNTETVVIRNGSASFSQEVVVINADRNTSNNSYYFLRGNVPGVGTRFLVADSGAIGSAGGISLGNVTPPTSGIGVQFPATQSASSDANTLDDYEEGTWTPDLRFNGGSTGITYSSRDGLYTKIGKCVYFSMRFTLSNKGSSTGVAEVHGLPFTVGTGTAGYSGATLCYSDNTSGFNVTFQMTIDGGQTNIKFRYSNGTNTANMTNGNFSNSSDVILSGFYFV